MPREASGKREAQRERQRRYRQRLRSSGTSAVDVAVSAAVSAMAEAVRKADEQALDAVRGRREALSYKLDAGLLSDDEADDAFAELMLPAVIPQPAPLAPAEFVRRVLNGAVALLVDRECDQTAAKRMVVRGLGRGGDISQLEDLIMRSKVSVGPKRSRRSSQGDAP